MPTLLDDALLTETLGALPGWQGDHGGIWRELRATPEQVTELRREVDVDADAMAHHPKVDLGDGTVRFTLTTPDSGGVTELDIALAAHISDLIHRVTGQPGIGAGRAADDPIVVHDTPAAG